ncbi:MAG: hypothetical protein J6C19_11655 [Lachnospiraceae bacterium]|nr:hypothetical protein [Lachnospiraceae bacterium]MBO5291766.1 hypothetical protein [Lachnospiraceae bacterium]
MEQDNRIEATEAEDLRSQLPQFEPITITLNSGERLNGFVTELQEIFFKFMDEDGKFRPVPYVNVKAWEKSESETKEQDRPQASMDKANEQNVMEPRQDKAGYLTGNIKMYNPVQGFGVISDGLKEYQFIRNNVAEQFQESIRKGIAVTFLPSMVYSPKKKKNVPAALDVTLFVETPVTGEMEKLAKQVELAAENDESGERLPGRIEFYNPNTKSGYVIDEKGTKLNFSWKDLKEEDVLSLNCEKYSYDVFFELDLSHPIPKAKNIELKNRVQKAGIDGADQLQEHEDGTLCHGKIGYYNPEVKAGYLIYEGNKLNYSWKDIENFDAALIDLKNYEYDVSFFLDTSRKIIKATNIRIVKQTESEGGLEMPFLNIGEVEATQLLKFVLEHFRLSEMQAILSRKEQHQIGEDGVYRGENYEQTMQLVEDLNACGKSETRFDKVTYALKPNLPLAAAKIAQQYIDENQLEQDAFFNEKKINQCLYNYAMMLVIGGRMNNQDDSLSGEGLQGERMYYAESVLNNIPDLSAKSKVLTSCIAEYFANRDEIRRKLRKGGYTSMGSVINLMKGECTNWDGLIRTLFNLPAVTFKSVLNEMEKKENSELAEKIADALRNKQRENGMEQKEQPDRVEMIEAEYRQYIRRQESLKSDTFSVGTDIVESIAQIVPIFEEAERTMLPYLLKSDMEYLNRVGAFLRDLAGAVENESPVNRVQNLHGSFAGCRSILKNIEEHPSRISFEILRPFLSNLQLSMKEYLEKQYADFAPKLTVEHYAISDDHQDETLEISNADGRLPAFSVRIEAVPYETDCFKIDDTGNRKITGLGRNINQGEAMEVRIPLLEEREGSKEFEMEITLSYMQYTEFDSVDGTYVTAPAEEKKFQLQIPLYKDERDDVQYNKYMDFASGKVMEPDNEHAVEMFFGRDKDIDDVYKMIVDQDGRLNKGSIVAIYGQKRCGKTSVMHFLGKKIEENFPDVLLLSINVQGIGCDEKDKGFYYRCVLALICSELRAVLRGKHRELYKAMREEGIDVPDSGLLIAQGGEAVFWDFFKSFESWRSAVFGDRYPIVLMVDEFTQAYINMKSHMVGEDFLNRWRVMIQEAHFVNIIVGQDFMDQFTSDEEITSQNFGGAVNGLGTMGRKRLSYLDFASAREMIEKPIPFQNGSSRYRGKLGEMAVRMIYELTGGSAFYLMKFCNCLTAYMMEKHVQAVTTDIVREVANGYAFDTRNIPIEKKDFDPIYNEFSCSDNEAEEEGITASISRRMKNTYAILKQIADKSNSSGECNVENLIWEDETEKKEILRSLIVRGVLTDRLGKDITTENIDHITVKIKVGIFRIWLKERG